MRALSVPGNQFAAQRHRRYNIRGQEPTPEDVLITDEVVNKKCRAER